MALAVSCACGARFDVADTFASQNVSCPECQRSVKVPAADRGPLRTSGYALASLVLALIGMFTVIFTIAAVVLGIVGLVSIGRHRQQVTGGGYALCGIILGTLFTGLTLFALSRDEVFDWMREQVSASQVDYSGPMEIVREQEGFAVTRPSRKWGVARSLGVHDEEEFTLVNGSKDSYLQVSVEQVPPDQSVGQCRDEVLENMRNTKQLHLLNNKAIPLYMHDLTVGASRELPPVEGVQQVEVRVDFRLSSNPKLSGVPMTYLIRVYKRDGSGTAFVVMGMTQKQRLHMVEEDMHKAMDSFRILKK
jgi:hypothetical protein